MKQSMSGKQESDFYREYNLTQARKGQSSKNPAVHQAESLDKLHKWFDSKPSPHAGGILVLPTGGGKTFTAVRFLCTGPLSEGYKVLWLAHTHHLLEQAFYNFGPKDDREAQRIGHEVGWISEPRQKLNVRIISGTPGHFPIHQIKTSDDVAICTIQTVVQAYKNKHPRLMAFLDTAGDKLIVVFDEAHHSPAPSYRKLIAELRKRCSGMYLLGLTATPTHTDEKKRGWLKELFPQGIIYQTTPQKLIPEGILAQPILEGFQTEFKPEFDEREYQKWISTYRDIPEDIITELALSRDRNTFIADTYVEHKDRYGKTIVFADRWFQCDQLRELLRERKVRADVIYSHIDADPGSAEARNRRQKDENAQVLDAFRRNELDVLINVRMLTEGTDVPDVQTVFLTRQTTSSILLTQMIGRALRGPKFGGTEQAHIVSFVDNWMHLINWAEYDQLAGKPHYESEYEYGKRPPLHLISIDLVRRLIRQIGSGLNVSPVQFLTFVPIGWYRVEFIASVEGSDDSEPVRQLLMVFDKEKESYEHFIKCLTRDRIEEFSDEGVGFGSQQERLIGWRERFFSRIETHLGEGLLTNLFHITRHMAQNDKVPPDFFSFQDREYHNLDAVAQQFIDDDLGSKAINQALQTEYLRQDRYWRILYPNYVLFKSQYDACVNRILGIGHREGETKGWDSPDKIDTREPPEEIKEQVKARDGYRCLCCGSIYRLEIDHIAPSYFGGRNSMDNLQTLCSVCNGNKGINESNFRHNQTLLTSPPSSFPSLKLPPPKYVGKIEKWEQFIRRSINSFYQCTAVEDVKIGKRGPYFYHWEVRLYAGNDPLWLKPYLAGLVKRIRRVRDKTGLKALEGIRIITPDSPAVSYSNAKR